MAMHHNLLPLPRRQGIVLAPLAESVRGDATWPYVSPLRIGFDLALNQAFWHWLDPYKLGSHAMFGWDFFGSVPIKKTTAA